MLSTAVDTFAYMIAGYGVIFGSILGYVLSLVVRFRSARKKVSDHRNLLDERK